MDLSLATPEQIRWAHISSRSFQFVWHRQAKDGEKQGSAAAPAGIRQQEGCSGEHLSALKRAAATHNLGHQL